jgi:Kef-type K+ transport system membrane component KefB
MDKEDSLAVGFGMNSRGAMEIILGLIALEAGLINEELFVALVIMAVVTSIAGAPMMNFFF